MEYNPYAPPIAQTLPSATPSGEDGFIEEGRPVEAGRGVAWLIEGWALVKGNVGIWIVICIFAVVFGVALSRVPVVGPVALGTIAPLFYAGFFLGCRDIQEGRELRFGHFFAGFVHARWLLVICAVRLAEGLVGQGVGLIFGVGAVAKVGVPFVMSARNALHLSRVQALIAFTAVSLILTTPFSMLTIYAPALIVIRGMRPLAALKEQLPGHPQERAPLHRFLGRGSPGRYCRDPALWPWPSRARPGHRGVGLCQLQGHLLHDAAVPSRRASIADDGGWVVVDPRYGSSDAPPSRRARAAPPSESPPSSSSREVWVWGAVVSPCSTRV